MGEHQLLFSRTDAHAGRPPGAGITVTARWGGVIVRITDLAGDWYEVSWTVTPLPTSSRC